MTTKTKLTKIDKIILDIYQILYNYSEPPADFEYLMKVSPKDKKGRIMIPFDKHFINQELYNNIVESELKRHRLSKHEKEVIRFQVYLGCGPTYKEK